jgi:RND family efflux transporter MFP subunit
MRGLGGGAAADATVASNAANVRHFQELTSFERVTAPFAGTIIQRNVDVGALIMAGSPTNNTAAAPSSITGGANGLFEVARIDWLRVFVNVPQAYAPNVHAGLPASVSVRGQLMEPVVGTVTRTANALDPATRTLLVEVDVPNASQRLLPGMFVYVAFKISAAGTRWRVPATAAVIDAQGTRVALVGPGNKLHYQSVVFGRDLGAFIDVQAGLSGGESVIKQPTVSLQEGQVVRPIAPQPPSDD